MLNDVTASDPRWRPHGVRFKMAAPRRQIQDGGPCDVFGYASTGRLRHVLERGVVLLLYVQVYLQVGLLAMDMASG